MKPQVAVVDVSQVKKDLSIEVPALEVKAAIEKTYDNYQRQARVPGFRQGKVPRVMVKQRFAKEVKDEVIQHLLPHALQHAIMDSKLRVIGEPHIADVSLDESHVLRFKATVEVLPDFELNDYKGLQVTKRVRQILDKDIDDVVERYREATAKYVDVPDRASQSADFVNVNLTGKYLNPTVPHEEEGLTSDGVTIELDAEGVQAEFNESLTGVKPGEIREFRVVYPEDFTSKGLAGKTLDFTATVITVQTKELPEITDDWVKESGQHASVQEMRDTIREQLTQSAEQDGETRMRDELVETLLEDYEFQVPASLIEQQTQDRLRRFAYQLMYSGMPQEYASTINWEERAAEARVAAARDIRAALVIGHIGENEGVQVTAGEIEAEIAAMAAENGMTESDMKASLTKDGGLSSIESRLNYNKALDLIVSSAQVTVEEVTAEQLAQAAAEKNAETVEPTEQSPELTATID